jgi:hypothetical protein
LIEKVELTVDKKTLLIELSGLFTIDSKESESNDRLVYKTLFGLLLSVKLLLMISFDQKTFFSQIFDHRPLLKESMATTANNFQPFPSILTLILSLWLLTDAFLSSYFLLLSFAY